MLATLVRTAVVRRGRQSVCPCRLSRKLGTSTTFKNSGGIILPPDVERERLELKKQDSVPPVKEQKNRLLRELCGLIRFGGPITVAQYMNEVLTNPVSGYYTKKSDVLGARGDFVTSPEISQMFGECLGVWILSEWLKMGAPPLQLVELGPGRGTLMKDVLRTLKTVKPECLEKISIHLVEVSDAIRNLQMEALCDGEPQTAAGDGSPGLERVSRFGPKVTWHKLLRDVPAGFSFFLAHEFFDALPVNKFVRGGPEDAWNEVLVDVDAHGDALRFVRAKDKTPAATLIDLDEAKTELEISLQSGVLINQIRDRIVTQGGALLLVDYGHEGDKGDTLRGFKEHKLHDPLADPGEADLTADVDFAYLKREVARGGDALCYGPVPQRSFLHELAIQVRAQVLLKACSDDERRQEEVMSAYRMLTDADKMGERFKMLAVFPATMEEIHEKYPPAGFASIATNNKNDATAE